MISDSPRFCCWLVRYSIWRQSLYLPLQQRGVRRAFNLQMKRRFGELGIEIPFLHQTIYFGEDRDGNAPAAPPTQAPPTGRRSTDEDQMDGESG